MCLTETQPKKQNKRRTKEKEENKEIPANVSHGKMMKNKKCYRYRGRKKVFDDNNSKIGNSCKKE